MKCQNTFLRKNKNKQIYSILSSAVLDQRMVNVKAPSKTVADDGLLLIIIIIIIIIIISSSIVTVITIMLLLLFRERATDSHEMSRHFSKKKYIYIYMYIRMLSTAAAIGAFLLSNMTVRY